MSTPLTDLQRLGQEFDAPDPAADQWSYKGWDISFDAKPIPTRSFDWMATSPDYDASYEGPEDGWVCSGHHVSAATYEELLEEIEACIAEQDDPAA